MSAARAASRAALAGRALVARHCARRDVRARALSSATASTSGRDDAQHESSVSSSASSVTPLRVYHADWVEVKLPEGHRFPMDKYKATRLALESDASLAGKMEIFASPEAPLDDILAVHEEGYVRRVLDCALTEKETRAIGFPMQHANVVRSLASTGGTLAAMHDVMRDGSPHLAAAQIAGGTHHAFADRGEGFCVFNDQAVAAMKALWCYPERLAGTPTPVLIIDLDVHQGNGTAKIFEDDPRVVTFSAHGAGNYPWKTKMRSTHDLDLPDDTDDDAYNAHMAEWLPFLFDAYDPRLVFFQAGVDALREDSFGRLAMTRAGLLRRNHAVYDQCVASDVPLVITMGGGYSRPWDASVAAHADVFRSAAYRFASPRVPRR